MVLGSPNIVRGVVLGWPNKVSGLCVWGFVGCDECHKRKG